MDSKKKYGSLTIFVGSITLVCSLLIKYYISFIEKFAETEQTYDVLSEKNLFGIVVNKYISLFTSFFGDTPSTPLLAIFIPGTIVLTALFFYYLYKYINQKHIKKMKSKEEAVFNDQSTIQG